MHPAFFHIKRAHWRSVRVRGAAIRQFDMTCARLEVMHIIDRHYRGVRTQAGIARELGVKRQTVWQMVVRMARHGLVQKFGRPGRVGVRLTDKGRHSLNEARWSLRRHKLQRALQYCFPHLDAEHASSEIIALKFNVRAVALGFRDTSTYGDSIDEHFHPPPPVFREKKRAEAAQVTQGTHAALVTEGTHAARVTQGTHAEAARPTRPST